MRRRRSFLSTADPTPAQVRASPVPSQPHRTCTSIGLGENSCSRADKSPRQRNCRRAGASESGTEAILAAGGSNTRKILHRCAAASRRPSCTGGIQVIRRPQSPRDDTATRERTLTPASGSRRPVPAAEGRRRSQEPAAAGTRTAAAGRAQLEARTQPEAGRATPEAGRDLEAQGSLPQRAQGSTPAGAAAARPAAGTGTKATQRRRSGAAWAT